MKISLASDNIAPAHPDILKALMDANKDCAPSYGMDCWTQEATSLIQKEFKTSAKVLIVPTGTGANVLALKLACRPFQSILCSAIAHINYQESGSPEAIVGCKLIPVPHFHGKITPLIAKKQLAHESYFGKHSTSPKILSITQPTEVGTIYTLDELKALSDFCKEEGLFLHIDGSRLYNAAAALDTRLSDITEAANPDILSLGGTKNGLISAEAILIFNPLLQEGSDHLQKQSLQLPSKMRYFSVQFLPFFRDGLWKRLAKNANEKASLLARYIESNPELKLSYPVETNQIFFTSSKAKVDAIRQHIDCFLWEPEIHEIRFITSWNTTQEDIQSVMTILADRTL